MFTNSPSTVDDVFDFLGGRGSFGDRELNFLAAKGYTSGDINQRWMLFLTSRGFTSGDVATRQQAWLRAGLMVKSLHQTKGFKITGSEVTLTPSPSWLNFESAQLRARVVNDAVGLERTTSG